MHHSDHSSPPLQPKPILHLRTRSSTEFALDEKQQITSPTLSRTSSYSNFSFCSSPTSSIASSIFLPSPKPLDPICSNIQVSFLNSRSNLIETIFETTSQVELFLPLPNSSPKELESDSESSFGDTEESASTTSTGGGDRRRKRIKRKRATRSERLPRNALLPGSNSHSLLNPHHNLRDELDLDDFSQTSSFAPSSPRLSGRVAAFEIPICTCSPLYDDGTTTSSEEEEVEEVKSKVELQRVVETRKKRSLFVAGMQVRSRGCF